MKHYTVALGFCMMLFSACNSDDLTVEYPVFVEEVGGDYEDCRLVWSEEFDYEGLPDEKTWGYEEGYQRNYEVQDYRKSDTKYTRVEDGKLIIEAHNDPHDADGYHFDYSSASIHTKGKVNFKYGRIDIAAKIPVGRGMYPVFWMLPVNDEYGAWPKSGEINIAAYTFGGYWGNQYEKNTVSAWLHTENTANGVPMEPGVGSVATMENAYHLYSMVWKKKRIQFLLDNKVIFTYDKRTNTSAEWPFNKDFYLLMSLAVGGVEGGAFGIDAGIFPKRMEVDYVRYYELLQDDETDEVEDPNLIKNGGFEQDFEEGKEPAVINIDKEDILGHLNQWYVKNKGGEPNSLEVDNTDGVNGSVTSLKFHCDKVSNYWDHDICFPIAGQTAGTYKFSFYVKTNKEVSHFTSSITFCTSEDEIKDISGQFHKAVWVKTDGTQVIATAKKESGGHPYSAIYGKPAGMDWTKYTVTVNLPETLMIRFLIKPNAKSEDGGQWPRSVNESDITYWFDDFSFEKVD